MMDRRSLVMAGMGLAALGVAETLRPRHKLVLLKSGTIEEAIPAGFGTWTSEVSGGLVSPEQAGRLAKSLYSEMVSRIYFDEATGASAMVLIAYGDTQSDLLQLHRPESCYPAVGFTLEMTKPVGIGVAPGVVLPGREVTAVMDDRIENIVYWTRLGERLPRSAGEQRAARLRNAMDGYVADGILVRCSVLGEPSASFSVLRDFVPGFLKSIPMEKRNAFVGTHLARQLG